MAASFTSASRAAPARPSHRSARPRRKGSSASPARGTCFSLRWTWRIRKRPPASGKSTRTTRSNRPGLSSASSKTSGRFVAPTTTTGRLAFPRPTRPSMQVSSWLSVCSASWLPPVRRKSFPRARSASTSSIKTMQGASFRARSNNWRTRAAPRPTKSSTNSVAAAFRKGTPASAAQARASRVFPEPGGPTKRIPRGTRAPSVAYRSGDFSMSTTSLTCSLAPSMPAMSSKRVARASEPSACCPSSTFWRASPQVLPFPPPVMRRSMVKTMRRYATIMMALKAKNGRLLVFSATMVTFAPRSAAHSSSAAGRAEAGQCAE
mmetsp:Transcript_3646/g.10007  ORF Transcript_3646/g.10007 Transcript_3646/m.10007 type:complete len:320 (-) Transcript_3646:322-1281(-)